MKIWTLIFMTKYHIYWKHGIGFYNCTLTDTPPSAEAGYYDLSYLLWVKGERAEERIKC